LVALDEAQTLSRGNQGLEDFYEDIRKAVAAHSLEAPDEPAEGSGDPLSTAPVPDAVRAWRAAAAQRLPGVVHFDEVSATLVPSERLAGQEDDLAELIRDLDRRVHSKRLAPPADRPHYEQDLRGILSASFEQGVSSKTSEDLEKEGPELRRILWEVKGEVGSENAAGLEETMDDGRLAEALSRAGNEGGQSVVSMLQVATRSATPASALSAIDEIEPERLDQIWRSVRELLRVEFRNLDELTQRLAGTETKVGAEIGKRLAIPFAAIEEMFFGYFQLRQQLADAGWRRAADGALGSRKDPSKLEPSRYEIRGEDSERPDRVVIKTLGLTFKDKTIRRSIVEAVSSGLVGETDERDGEQYHDGREVSDG
jgi:hypothetical protein